MTKVSMKTNLPASATKVWDIVGGFNALPDWHPGIEKSELAEGGSQRRLALAGSGEVVEQETDREEGHSYSYSILAAPLPVSNYRATIKVTEDADGNAQVEWSSEFEPTGAEQEASDVIRGIYQAGLDNLKKMLGG